MRQVERSAATSRALVAAARALFAADGYDATSLAAVAGRAGVTKGALYHHFGGKQQLFEAVFVQEIDRMTGPLTAAYREVRDPWQAFASACRAFLVECLDPGVQRIVLRDATAALGWERVRRLETPLLEMMEAAISAAVDAGLITARPPGLAARFLFGALCEIAMVIARADDPDAVHRAAVAEICRILDGFRD